MLTGTIRNRILDAVVTEEAQDVSMSWLIDKGTGAPNFAMRLFKIEPGGHTPCHTHDWEHEVFVVNGKGRVWAEDGWKDLERGSFVLVVPNEKHQFVAADDEPLEFLCLVPNDSY